MTKAQIVKGLAESMDITQTKAAAAFDAVVDSIFEAVEKTGSFRTSYGTLKLKETAPRPARKGRNPKTGEEINIPAKPASKKISFTMSKSYKEDLNS